MSRAVRSGVVAVGLVLGFLSDRVAACSCGPLPSPQESLARAASVFRGRLVAAQEIECSCVDSIAYEATFSVLEAWKGPVSSRIKVVVSVHRIVCQTTENAPIFPGEWLVYAFEDPGILGEIPGGMFVQPCDRTSRFDPLEAEELGESLWSRAEDEVPFLRGDVNFDGKRDISDPITILRFFFLGAELFCQDAADANDDGIIDITDPLYLLAFLFVGAEPIPPPAVQPGLDTTVDRLACVGPPDL